jgi:hypothetical protein
MQKPEQTFMVTIRAEGPIRVRLFLFFISDRLSAKI